jgi:hypothetical protein
MNWRRAQNLGIICSMHMRLLGTIALLVTLATFSCGGGATGAEDGGADGHVVRDSGPPADARRDAVGDVLVDDAARDSGAPGDSSTCSEATDATKQAENCNPVDPYSSDSTHEACCPGLTCEVTFDRRGDTVCQSGVGPGGQGATCASFSDCQAGYRCTLNVGSIHRCRKLCVLGSSAGCPTGTTCDPFDKPAYDGKVELGLCAIPVSEAGGD